MSTSNSIPRKNARPKGSPLGYAGFFCLRGIRVPEGFALIFWRKQPFPNAKAVAGCSREPVFHAVKSASRHRHHGKAHRPENAANIRRGALQDNALARRSHRIPRGRARGIETNLHWRLDITIDEDRGRSSGDFSPPNFVVVRHMVFNILKRDQSKLSLKHIRLKASENQTFRALLAC